MKIRVINLLYQEITNQTGVVKNNSNDSWTEETLARLQPGYSSSILQINLRLLNLMFQREPLKDLIQPAKRFGRRDRRTWTYVIEEEFFDPLLLALVKNTRRAYRNDGAIAT